MATIGLAGDTMLGRGVADALATTPPTDLFSDDVVAAAHEADILVVNLECCISDRGERWTDPRKPFFFRGPPIAVEVLAHLGVDAVTLANNHALDYGVPALLDTLRHLGDAGIVCVGAGPDVGSARTPAIVEGGGLRLGVVGLTDHPEDFAARPHRPGVAYADLRAGEVPGWVSDAVADASATSDLVLVTPHWGPNMTTAPVRHVQRAARELAALGVGLVAGHSAHVFHGAEVIDGTTVLYDLGDLIDDYAVDPQLRNDLGLLWLLEVADDGRPQQLEAVPLALDFCHTRLAEGDDLAWITERFTTACAEMGTDVVERDDRLVVDLS